MKAGIDKSYGLIPMRGGSKSIPKKNIKLLNNKPLFYWSLSEAIKSKTMEKIFVSSDSQEILDSVATLFPNVELIMRPSEFASDTASTESVIEHFTSIQDYQKLTLIQITSPLTTSADFQEAHEKFNLNKYDSLFTGVLQKRFYWSLDSKPLNYDPMNRPRRQDFDGHVVENGAFYIFKKENFLKYHNRLGGKIGCHLMTEDNLFEIDEPLDFIILENIMNLR